MVDDGTNIQSLAGNSSGELIAQVKQNGTWTSTVTQATAASLNATVVGTGTFATQAAQSGTWNITNVSGTISLPTGAATAAKQPALGIAGTASADVITVQGIASMTALKVDGSAVTQPVSGTFWQATQPVSAASLPLPTGAATAVLQTQPGVDIGDVTVNNTSGASAVNIQDGGNSITVDNGGTFAVQATLSAETTKVIGTVNQGTSPWVTSNATTSVVGNGTSATAQRVTLSNDSTGVIATVGAVTAITNALPAGTNVIGKVSIDQTTPGTTNLVALAANQSVNVAQMNGVATSMGVGASGTGVQRVVLANDQGKTLLSAGGSASSSGNNTLVAAGTNKLKIYAFTLSTTSTTAMTCIFQSGASGTELWRVVLQAPTSVSTGANLVVQPPAWLFATASATLLNLNLSSANAVNWSVSYFDEA